MEFGTVVEIRKGMIYPSPSPAPMPSQAPPPPPPTDQTEVQVIQIRVMMSYLTPTGAFKIMFKGATTPLLQANSSAHGASTALGALPAEGGGRRRGGEGPRCRVGVVEWREVGGGRVSQHAVCPPCASSGRAVVQAG